MTGDLVVIVLWQKEMGMSRKSRVHRVNLTTNGLKNLVGSGQILWAAGRRGCGAGYVIGGGCAGEAGMKTRGEATSSALRLTADRGRETQDVRGCEYGHCRDTDVCFRVCFPVAGVSNSMTERPKIKNWLDIDGQTDSTDLNRSDMNLLLLRHFLEFRTN